MNNSFFNSSELIRLLSRWRKHLIIVGLVSLVLSVLFSSPWFIKPKFKSTAIVYPSNLIAYSEESPTEQMLQLAHSSDIRDRVIRRFNLISHYNIDTTNNNAYRTAVINEYEENVRIRQTEYESMEITVFDTDPVIASAMVDSIIHYFDLKARELQAEKSYEVMIIAKEQLENKQADMDSMENILKEYREKFGLLDYRYQAREVVRAYLRSAGSNSASFRESNEMLKALQDKGGEFLALNEHLWRVRGTYNDLKIIYEEAVRDVYKKLTYANVVTRPQPADKKSYPVRWLIVVISVSSSLLMAFIILLVFYSRPNIKNAA